MVVPRRFVQSSRFMRKISLLMFALGLLSCPHMATAATIEVGHHTLQANRADQVISISVTGGDAVAGVNLYAQVGDGGPELRDFGLTPGSDGPEIASVNLRDGTIFETSNSPQDVQPSVPQVAVASIELAEPQAFTSAEGILAWLTIDTRGFDQGTWPLLLSGVLPELSGGPFDTDFAGQPVEIINGSIEIGGKLLGDFNGDGLVDVLDIDLIQAAVRDESTDQLFDLNQDGTIEFDDIEVFVDVSLKTWFGDSNLDGLFNTADLVSVFQAGEYEDATTGNSNWSRGDWDGDGDFGTSDLVLAFTSNGFEQGPRTATLQASVPEPTFRWPWLAIAILQTRIARYRRSR